MIDGKFNESNKNRRKTYYLYRKEDLENQKEVNYDGSIVII